jgi:hypothetical protein
VHAECTARTRAVCVARQYLSTYRILCSCDVSFLQIVQTILTTRLHTHARTQGARPVHTVTPTLGPHSSFVVDNTSRAQTHARTIFGRLKCARACTHMHTFVPVHYTLGCAPRRRRYIRTHSRGSVAPHYYGWLYAHSRWARKLEVVGRGKSARSPISQSPMNVYVYNMPRAMD